MDTLEYMNWLFHLAANCFQSCQRLAKMQHLFWAVTANSNHRGYYLQQQTGNMWRNEDTSKNAAVDGNPPFGRRLAMERGHSLRKNTSESGRSKDFETFQGEKSPAGGV